jgi:hypothetical protein
MDFIPTSPVLFTGIYPWPFAVHLWPSHRFTIPAKTGTNVDDYTAKSLRRRKEKLMIFFIWARSMVQQQ